MGDDYDNDERAVSDLEDVHATLNEILSTLKSRSDFSALLWLAFLVFLLESWSGSKLDRWTDKVWYSSSYNIEFKSVTIEKRPRDCDFLFAPIGNKGCRYKKRTEVFGEEQRRALVHSVTVYWEKVEE